MATDRREKDELRVKRAQIDHELLGLLVKRARLSREWAARQSQAPAPVLPSGERDSLDELARAAGDDLPAPAVLGIFREIHAVCRSLEAPVRAAYCGPEGGHAYVVARRQFGALAGLMAGDSVVGTLEHVERKRADFAVLPYESAAEGLAYGTLLALRDTDLKVIALHEVDVSLSLVSLAGDLATVEQVYVTASDRAAAQLFLDESLPRATVVEVKTPLAACSQAADSASTAALAVDGAGEKWGLGVLARGVGEGHEKRQRFCVVSPRPASRTGRDATALLFAISDAPGALFEALKHFAERGVNLRKIQSRAVEGDDWEYLFYVEVSGHVTDRAVVTALEGIKRQTKSFKVLGSYPA